MQTTIHDVKRVTMGEPRKLGMPGETVWVRDIVITSEDEQLVITMFSSDEKVGLKNDDN